MLDPCQQFLSEIERFGSKKLDSQELSGLRRELAAHLDAAVQARMELGATREEAEVASVKAMGPPKMIVGKFAEVDSAKQGGISWPYLWIAGVGAPFTLTLALLNMGSTWFLCFYYSAWAFLSGAAIVGWRERHPAWKAFHGSAIGTFGVAMVGWSAMFVQMPTMMPSQISEGYATVQTRAFLADSAVGAISLFERSEHQYRAGQTRTITFQPSNLLTSSRDFPDQAEGLAFIDRYRSEKMPKFQRYAADQSAARQALDTFIRSHPMMLVQASLAPAWQVTWTLGLIAMGMNFLGVALRWLWDRQLNRIRNRLRPL